MENGDGLTGAEVRRSVRVSSRRGSIEIVAEQRRDVVATKGGEPIDLHDSDDGISVSSRRSPLVVRVPEGTDVVVGTVSGRVTCTGRLGDVSVNTVSARIDVEHAARVDARSTSGRVEVRSCEGEVRCDVASGRAEVGAAGSVQLSTANGRIVAPRVGGKVRARTVNGRIEIGVTETPIDVAVEAVNGRIEVRVPVGARPSTRLRSMSGRVRCGVEEGSDGTVRARTVAGSIVIEEGLA